VTYVPADDLIEVLNEVLQMILLVDESSPEREELAQALFKAVMGLPDVSKEDGISWWLRHREELESRRFLSAIRARL
jgi:hypothetical protein